MKALIITLAILLVLAWIPISCRARYLGAPRVDVRVGPVRFRVYPGKDKPKKQPMIKIEKSSKKSEGEQPEGTKKKVTLDGIMQYLPLAQTGLKTLGRLFRTIAVRLKLHVTYGAEDPADAAVRYGQAWAIIGVVTPVLEKTFHIKKRDVQAIFDPEETGFAIEVDLTARLFVWQVLAIVVSAGIKLLVQFLKIRKGGANK